jgi:hypothetical protein
MFSFLCLASPPFSCPDSDRWTAFSKSGEDENLAHFLVVFHRSDMLCTGRQADLSPFFRGHASVVCRWGNRGCIELLQSGRQGGVMKFRDVASFRVELYLLFQGPAGRGVSAELQSDNESRHGSHKNRALCVCCTRLCLHNFNCNGQGAQCHGFRHLIQWTVS